MNLISIILVFFTFYSVICFPLGRRANNPNPMNGLVDLMMGQGSEGGLLELLFNGNGPIGSLIYNAAKLSSGEVGSGNHGLRANLSVGKGQRNNKVGNGVVNNL